jgi:class 3 adenylate cyclase
MDLFDCLRPAPHSGILPPMESGEGTGARRRLLLGSFLDPALEAEFQREHFELDVRRFVRVSIPLAVAVHLAYGFHDALLIPEMQREAWFVRLGLFGPVGILLTIFILVNRRSRWHQPAALALGMGFCAVPILIASLSPSGFIAYTSYVSMLLGLGPFVGQINVITAVSYTLLTVLLFNVVDVVSIHSAPILRLKFSMDMVTIGAIGAILVRQLEGLARVGFVQRRVIREQMAALDAERNRSEALLLNVLPAKIAARLKASPGVIADGFPSVTVLFGDIVGFTELSARLSPAELVRRLDDIFSRFDALVAWRGLEKIKTIGDAYMVIGGIPTPRDDHAEAVCDMALAMRDSMREIGGGLSMRIGVHTGPVVAGVIGKQKFIYDAWGDTVNTASRMESHGVAGRIQVTEAIRDNLSRAFEFEERGEIQVKGKGMMKTFFLVRRKAPPER